MPNRPAFQVDHQAMLDMIKSCKKNRGKAFELSGFVAARRLEFHHVCTRIIQQQPGTRTHDGVAEFKHAQSFQ